MKSQIIRLAMLIATIITVSTATATAEVSQVPVVRLEASLAIDASPADVWSHMVSGSNIGWCPYWKVAANDGHADLARVGDVLDFVDDWGGGGQSIVTYFEPGKELRIAHEPRDGSYVCQSKLILSATGTGTTIHYVEQYTDESDAATLADTAGKMQTQMESTLAAIRKGVEAH